MGWILKNRYKLRGAYFVLQLLLAFILIGFFAVAGVYSGSDVIDTYKASLIQKEGEALDMALRQYSRIHTTSYPTGQIDDRGVPITKSYGMYPEFSELEYQVRYGYISSLLAPRLKVWSAHGSSALSGDFYYETSADRRAYLLQAKLPNGYIYTSPGSLLTLKELENASTVGNEISSGKNEWGSSISGKSMD